MASGRRVLVVVAASGAAAFAGWAAVVLYRGPAGAHGFGAPAPHWLVAVAALLWAAAQLLREGSAGRSLAWFAATFALAFTALVANGRTLGSGDTLPTAALPFSILRQGSLALPPRLRPSGPLPYWMVERRGEIVSRYPVATAVLAAPVYLPAALGPTDVRSRAVDELEKLAAALLTALGAGLVAVALARLAPPPAVAIACALYVLGTPILAVVGQALWQHTGAVLCLSIALCALTTLPPSSARALLVGLAAGGAVAARPIAALLAAGVLAALAKADARRALMAVAGAAVPVALFLLANHAIFGSALATGYGPEARWGWRPVWPDGLEGVAGVLLSPARGLFLISPVLAAALVASLAPRPRLASPLSKAQLRILAVTALGYFVLIGHWWAWHGGQSAGPRMLSDALPLLAPGLALAVEELRRRALAWRILALALTCWSIGTQALLAGVPPTERTRCLIWLRCEGDWAISALPVVAFARQLRAPGPAADVAH